jgi:hypothetical protein
MKRRMSWFCAFVLLTAAFSVRVSVADQAKAPLVDIKVEGTKKKEAPVLAGFGMILPKHSCTDSYSECMQGCGKAGGANCDLECVSDCNVCALDFGEEALDVCRQ